MKHARKDYQRIQDPSGLIPEDEPVFLLRSTDITAAAVVRYWADLNEHRGGDAHAIELARAHAELMDNWPVQKLADVPPDA